MIGKRFRAAIALAVSIGLLSIAVAWQQNPAPAETTEIQPVVNPPAPRYWKGNLHTHSLWSDGDDFPEMIADWYKQHQYHFLALTEHNVVAEADRWIDGNVGEGARGAALKKYLARFGESWVERREVKGKAQVRLKPLREFRTLLDEPGKFLMIPGEEISCKVGLAPVHMNAINLRDAIKPVDAETVSETIRVNLGAVGEQRKKTGWKTIAFLNHPNFGWAVRAEDIMLSDDLRYFEVFNGHPIVRNQGDETHVGCERMWDVLLALRLGKHHLPMVYGLATDDAHGYHVFGPDKANPGRGWVMVRAAHLTPDAIVHGLETGDFYSSSGVVLEDVSRQDNEFRIQIRAEKGVAYKTQFIATSSDASFESEPTLDKNGKPLSVTRMYAPEIGKVVAESEELKPTYKLTGKELYVRARVVSSKPHPNPSQKGEVETAWTQPIAP